MRHTCLLLSAVALLGLSVPGRANEAPVTALAIVTDLDNIDEQIKRLSQNEYEEPATPTGTQEGFMGVELIGVQQNAFVHGVDGFRGAEYDRLRAQYDATQAPAAEASGKAYECQQRLDEADNEVQSLERSIKFYQGSIESAETELEVEEHRDPPDWEKIRKLDNDLTRYRGELHVAQEKLPEAQSRLATARSELPGLQSAAEAAWARARGPDEQLLKEETRLFEQWLKEE